MMNEIGGDGVKKSEPSTRVNRRDFLQQAGMASVALAAGAGVSSQILAQGLPRPGAADWRRFGYDLHNTRFNARETVLGPDNVSRLKLKWTFQAEAQIQTTPTVIGDTLFFGAHDGYQYALESATGKLKWKFKAPGEANRVRSSCQYVEGRIYFGDNDTTVRCLDAAQGREIWRTTISDPKNHIFCSVAVNDGKVVVGYSSPSESGGIACLDAETGAVRWQFPVVREALYGGGSVWTSPAIDEEAGVVYNVTGSLKAVVPSTGPVLYTESILAHDLDSGELLWYHQARPSDPFDLDFGCHPMIVDAVAPAGYRGRAVRQCVIAGNKAGIFSFNRYTGERYWKVMLTKAAPRGGPLLNSTAIAYNRIYLVNNAINPKGDISVSAALNAYNGDIEWWTPNEAVTWGPVAVANGVFYQGLADNSLEALDAEEGRSLWKYQLPTLHRGGIAIANGALYTSNGAPMTGWTPEQVRSHDYLVHAFTVDGV